MVDYSGTTTKKREFYAGADIHNPETPIKGLIKKLNSADVEISLEDCEKKISYRVGVRIKESTVPFLLDIGNHANIKSYILNQNQCYELRIELQNYSQIIGSGMIGCRTGDSGVLCSIDYKSESDWGDVVSEVINVLGNFYSPSSKDFIEAIKKLRRSKRKGKNDMDSRVRNAISKGGITGKPLKKRE